MKTFMICDDHALIRDALASSLEQGWPGSRAVKCKDYVEAFAAARDPHDLCICDVRMPGAIGVSGIEELLRIAPQLKVVALTGTADREAIAALLQTGVRGIIPKTLDVDAIIGAIRLVLADGVFLPDEVRAMALAQRPSAMPVERRLTDKQAEVMSMIVEGLTNKEIARRLDIQPSTVNSHIDGIFMRLKVKSRAEACAVWIKAGIR